ncbi:MULTISPECIES: prolyl oligopeptidase family protein [unclassified Shewanella]|uniref:prolyl oligopeptidase family serine peptidase n=1 Tax=unclassified Shewanella TaxID=196818 RepID=UPI001BC599FD|nr:MULTISPECIES: prolyl oligopeptidase family serine peptidase [unclassified Shewanella]GIU19224.1 prolyl oligopeptidase [Shewanella sp. MBTL60-112-B1]GIU25127.1 prolyl oligopeptidase [Shewanella sp. MBTL60-112-B2]
MRNPLLSLCVLGAMTAAPVCAEEDNYLWLEDVEGAKQMEWVKQQNAVSAKEIKAFENFDDLVSNSLAILNDKERIPYASRIGDYLYNFWKDENHVRGIYRRTTMEEYKKASPKWQTVLDIDKLGKDEGVNWVYKGFNCRYPENDRCFVSLSRGGADATEVREFDLNTLAFVDSKQQAFFLEEAKSSLSWIDKNNVFVGTDFGDNSMTDSGYPKIVKQWQRGTPLSSAKTVFSGDQSSVAVSGYVLFDGDNSLEIVTESLTFYTADHYVYRDGKLVQLPLPKDAELKGYFNGQLYVELKSDLAQGAKQFKQGSIIYTPIEQLIAQQPTFTTLVEPSATASISQVSFTKSAILVTWLDNVKGKLVRYTQAKDGQWKSMQAPFDANGTISVFDVERDSDEFFVNFTSFLEPSSLYSFNAVTMKAEKVKGMKQQFAADKFETKQYFATSKDGTKVPYFVVMAKDLKRDGTSPTLLYGYGGFEVSLRPYYSATIGKNWLEQGGVYVLANIRGGGEYGPAWHQAALKQNRHKAYEDFEAIAEDLIAKKITSSEHLGIQGGSNGGLLMGAAFTRKPELYGAVVCQVPLLDMKRYNKLLAGASWMGEYGDPDIPAEWDYIKTFSPYHNLKADTAYPKVFFTTSTRDDRVHPAHARKMVAKMEGMGIDVLYYENIEGGHAGAADNNQAAELKSMVYAYLMQQLR